MKSLTRRRMLSATGSVALASTALWSACGSAFAQAPPEKGQGLLAKLQAAKKVRIGIVNSPPYSALNPDGTVTGAVPTITKRIMDRLGIPQIEGFLASYGDLIPGMQAGRWDFTSAALTITQARCGQVKFGDPMIFDGANIVALKGHPGPMPKRLSELAKGNFVVGAPAGGVDLKSLLAAGVSSDNIRQFTNDQSAVDGLLAKRVDFLINSPGPILRQIKLRNLELDMTYPVEDDPPRGASCAFRPQDTDLYDAYVKQMRAMRASGELSAILKQFDFDTSPELLNTSTDQLCSAG
jgi:polar amino acid transport system substrate-binding protein